MIDQFNTKTFEKYLTDNHSPYLPLGEKDGEYAYLLPLDGQSAIEIRSSIKLNGQVAKSGKNSIRCWLVDNEGQPIGSKINNWTTRINGWQDRLFTKVLELVKRRIAAGDCRKCNKPFGVYKQKKDSQLFVKCWPCSERLNRNIVGNLDNPGWFSKKSKGEQISDKEKLDKWNESTNR